MNFTIALGKLVLGENNQGQWDGSVRQGTCCQA